LQSDEVEQGIVQTWLMPFGTSGEQKCVHAQFAFEPQGLLGACGQPFMPVESRPASITKPRAELLLHAVEHAAMSKPSIVRSTFVMCWAAPALDTTLLISGDVELSRLK
jgi:hypothetical protein